MKKILLLFIFLSFFETVSSQTRQNISIGYHRFFVSKDNLALFYSRQTNKNEWGVGLKYHLSQGIEEYGNFRDKNLYSKDWVQSVGLMAEYRRYFFDRSYKWTKFFRPYFVFHTAISYKEAQGFIYTFLANEEIYDYLLLKEKPLLFENSVGFGVRFFQDKKINGYLQTGGGLLYAYVDYLKYKCCGSSSIEWNYMLNLGLTYNLTNNAPPKKAKK
ncbi:MAG: hypothetical protein RL757_3279 [Bacteroidota bacterium]|jgi:hypothetical protein